MAEYDTDSSQRKIVVLASWSESLLNFRGQLLARLVERGHFVTACAPQRDDAVIAGLDAIGVRFETIDLHRTGMNPLHDAATLRAINATLSRLKPDILLSYTIKPVIYGSLAANKTGVKHICSIITGLGFAFGNETPRQKLANFAVKRLYKRSLSSNSKVFFQNPDDLKLFLDQCLIAPEQAVLINGSGVDLDYFRAEPLPEEPFSFLLIARLLKEKGVMEYAEAARILRESYPDVKFRLLGPFDGNPSAIRENLIDRWQEEGLIEYLGKTDDVRPAISASSVYVLPSYREGTPRSVLEAMATGRAIVTTDVAGCRETVIEGENGFLVPPRDPFGLAAAMRRFIDEPWLAMSMGLRSRVIAEQKYDVHEVNKVILENLDLNDQARGVAKPAEKISIASA